MKEKKIAKETYEHFSKLEGNDYIAFEFALYSVLRIINKYKIQNVLEIGLGIGSISYAVLKYSEMRNSKIEYFGTEDNEFCLKQLPLSLEKYFSELNLFNKIDLINQEKIFKMIIVDGSDNQLQKIQRLVSENGIIFIEGDRQTQLLSILSYFPNAYYTRVISTYKNPNYGPFSSEKWCGGGQLIFVNPNFKQKIHYLLNRIRTAFIYKFVRH